MKKVLLTAALVIAMGLGVNAQTQDGFFKDYNGVGNGLRAEGDLDMPVVPSQHGLSGDLNGAPVGSGLLVLTVLGGAYAIARRKE